MACFRTASLLVLLHINQDLCTALNVRHQIHRVSTRRNPYYFYNSQYRRMASTTTNLDDADVNLDTGTATAEISPTQMLSSAVPILCPKCYGEGVISKAPSKKSRLRHQRLIELQKEEEEQQRQNDNDHKRVKRSPSGLPSTTTTTTTTRTTNNLLNKDNEVKTRPFSMLPRRWDSCKICDQTGLLIPSSKNGTISSVTNTDAITHPIRNHPPFVAIIGGGIGGMALAVALRHRQIPFHIFEKDSRFDQRSQGYGLTLQQARRALRALGIVENDEDSDSVDDNDGNNNSRSSGSGKILQQHAVTSTKHVVHTPDGSICGEWGLRKWTGEANNKNNNETYISKNEKNETKNRIKPQSSRGKNKKRRQNLHVPRQTLRYVLYEALKEASADNNDDSPDISWGHKLVDIQPVFGDSSNNMCTTDNTNLSKIESETKQQSSTSAPYLLQPKVGLSFQVIDENGNDQGVVTSQADLVVGCDGIFSSVREKFLRVGDEDNHNGKDDSNYDDTDSDNDNDGVPLFTEPIATKAKGIVKQITPLRYLHCIVILGICSLGDLFKQESTNLTRQQQKQKQIQLSALLDGETVFQTADGTTRIYLMPYSKKNNEYMWQLSFPIPDEEIALDLSRRGPKALKDEALRRCQSWHVPIPEILNATPIELVSGYPVYDRDLLTAEILSTSRRREIIPRLLTTTTGTDSASTSSSFSFLPTTLLGDAAHPMSPFKGQGANQALIDALSLARILYRVHCREGRSLGDALELYEKEMMDRSSTKVRASSEAAKFLHTEIAIQKGDVTRGAAFSSSSVTKNK